MRSRPYDHYKASGFIWLGQVPQHWELRPLGSCFQERREKVSDTDFLPLSVTMNGVVPQLEHAAKTDDNDNRKCVLTGDFVINSRSDRRGSSGMATTDGSVSLINTVLTPLQGIDIRFVHHLLRSVSFQEEYYRFGKGIVADLWSTNYSAMKRICLAIPPKDEQEAIASFLDIETSKIDNLVSEQRRLIELLKEKRQAVISHAVTKGLNPKAPMKPSGIQWLGDVPRHWKIGKCGYYASILSGFAFPSSGFSDNESNTKLLRGINVGVSEIRWDEAVYWERQEDDGLDRFELATGDLVIGMDRPRISSGVRVAKIDEADLPCLLLQRVAKISTDDRLNTDFLWQLLSSNMFVAYFEPETTGVSVPHISPSQIEEFTIPLPPIEEQNEIVGRVETEKTRVGALIAEAKRAIKLLKERRTALISAAVTGKIDVRGWEVRKSA